MRFAKRAFDNVLVAVEQVFWHGQSLALSAHASCE